MVTNLPEKSIFINMQLSPEENLRIIQLKSYMYNGTRITEIQPQLMWNSLDTSLWMQKKLFKTSTPYLGTGNILGPERAEELITIARRKHEFKYQRLSEKKKNIWKIMDEHGTQSKDQHDILQVNTNEFSKKFKMDPNVTPHYAILILIDISIL